MVRPALIVHGGTSMGLSRNEAEMARALETALRVGAGHLEAPDGAARAVKESVKWLEASGLFGAGEGTGYQRDGRARMDASIGASDGRVGAVVGVERVGSPIEAAWTVRERVGHSTLVGPCADAVMEELGVAMVPPRAGTPKPVRQCVEEYLREGGAIFGTVGAVAIDAQGTLAAATSTGSYEKALPGRTGDSGAIGIGTYATARLAISCTGDGDRIVAAGLSAAIDGYLEAGASLETALDLAGRRMMRYGVLGGFILVASSGTAVVLSNVPLIRTASTVECRHLHPTP